jgi:hypothetical protein
MWSLFKAEFRYYKIAITAAYAFGVICDHIGPAATHGLADGNVELDVGCLHRLYFSVDLHWKLR